MEKIVLPSSLAFDNQPFPLKMKETTTLIRGCAGD